MSYRWLRTNVDGSDEQVIAGADGQSYVLTSADVGKKVLCRVTGTDGGGSASRTSAITDGPFANGAVVAAKVGSSAASLSAAGSLATAAQVAASAVPRCSSGVVKAFGTASALSRTYARSAVPLAGRLLDVRGGGLGGHTLELVQTVVRSGTATRTTVATVLTAGSGRFALRAPRGPSRALQVVDPTCGSVGPIVAERVRGSLAAKTTTHHVRNRQTARFEGRALGGYLGGGIPLELQVKVGRQWRDVKHMTSDRRGRFKVAYRFQRTFVRYTYVFRVVSRAGGAWPYLPASSRTVKVAVN